MPKFEFRLATLLKIREKIRDERRSALAQAYQADRILRDRQDEVDRQQDEQTRLIRLAVGVGRIDVDRLLLLQRNMAMLQQQAELLRQQRKQLEPEIERRRLTLVEADRQVRVLEKLREKQQKAFRKEQDRLEMKQLDEIAGRHVARED